MIEAHALLLAEKAMFQQVNKKGTKKASPNDLADTTNPDFNLSGDLDICSDNKDSDADVDDNDGIQLPIPLVEGKEWKKHVEENLCWWIETQGCC